MARVIEIDSAGAHAASLAENREDLDTRQKAMLGADLVLSPQAPQSQWSGILAAVLAEVGEEGVRAALFGSSVDHAQGTFLDALGSLLDVRRRVATRSRVTATLTGRAGTGVPAGSRAKTTDGDEFRTLADVTLAPEGVTVDLEAVETGPVAVDAGTLTEKVTIIAGWETITNPSAGSLGATRQSDEDYRRTYLRRTAHSSVGSLSALAGALEEALAGHQRVAENNTAADVTIQEWLVGAHSILVFSEGGSDGDVRRAIENHRGMGVGTMTAIRGAAPDAAALASMATGSIAWNGSTYTGLDLTEDDPGAEQAAALTAHLASDHVPPTISYINGAFYAIYRWAPGEPPTFGQSTDVAAFGLDPAAAQYPAGPFVRPRQRALTVSFTMTRRTGFPADGLTQARTAVLNQVKAYGIGDQLWSNDILCAAEAVRGTRITNLVVQAGGADVSGVDVPLDQLWTLDADDLTITVA